jgi:hypothetical protein
MGRRELRMGFRMGFRMEYPPLHNYSQVVHFQVLCLSYRMKTWFRNALGRYSEFRALLLDTRWLNRPESLRGGLSLDVND